MLKLHEKAVDIAEYAIFEKSKGNLDKAKKLFEKALNLELDAISKLTQNNEALRSILYRSAISLAMLNQMIEKKDLAGTIFECDSFPEEFLKRLKVKNYNHHKIIFNIENQLSIILSQGNDFYIDIKKNYGVDEQGNVVWLSLCDKNISDVSEIAKLSTIKLLDLSHNAISDISQLVNLKNLSKLIIYDNNIKDISALASLPRLETINIVNNPIESIYNTRLLFQDINLISGGDFKEPKIPEKPFSKQEFVESIVIDCDVPYEYSKYYTKKGVVELIKEITIKKCENGFFLVLKDKRLFVLGKNVSHVVSTHIEQLFELCGI
ncbi:leucine-rich repeat domain-containing protein, partial [Candidatus Woesearchaeota archaeon]|nr:leucine-rich repeat domain-containing protein [Candidatus Woesearchaeota archaeon]